MSGGGHANRLSLISLTSGVQRQANITLTIKFSLLCLSTQNKYATPRDVYQSYYRHGLVQIRVDTMLLIDQYDKNDVPFCITHPRASFIK